MKSNLMSKDFLFYKYCLTPLVKAVCGGVSRPRFAAPAKGLDHKESSDRKIGNVLRPAISKLDGVFRDVSVAGFCNSLSCRTVRFVKRGNEVYRSVPTSP